MLRAGVAQRSIEPGGLRRGFCLSFSLHMLGAADLRFFTHAESADGEKTHRWEEHHLLETVLTPTKATPEARHERRRRATDRGAMAVCEKRGQRV